jgi:hypothetical protein
MTCELQQKYILLLWKTLQPISTPALYLHMYIRRWMQIRKSNYGTQDPILEIYNFNAAFLQVEENIFVF